MYKKTTSNMTVTVEPVFLEDQSEPKENYFVWAYHVRIENNGIKTVKLCTRRWRITDSYGYIQEVEGAGVVGEQPVLAPGECYEYTSGTPLTTPGGIMVGSYEMEDMEEGEQFSIEIPAFSLDSPHQSAAIH